MGKIAPGIISLLPIEATDSSKAPPRADRGKKNL